MTQDGSPPDETYRQGLRAAVGAICIENGCDFVRKSALETLTEILQSYLSEVSRSTRQYCEMGGRSLPTLCDIQASLADSGFKFNKLPGFVKRKRRITIAEPIRSVQISNANVLLVGERRNFPNYIPENSSFPEFPDPHTYVRTLTGQKVGDDYGILRERGSSQRWDVERALTRFIAKTGTSHSLLPDDKAAFPLIAAVPPAIPYQSALLPCENEIVETSSKNNSKEKEAEQTDQSASDQNVKNKSSKRTSEEMKSSDRQSENIDNPYLRPAKTPKLKKGRR